MNIPPKNLMAVPIYQRIAEDLRVQVRAGRWEPGAALPSRRELAREYGVDLGTVQRAMAGLVEDGTLLVQARRGTTVPESYGPQSDGAKNAVPDVRPSEAVLGIVTGFSPTARTYGDIENSWTQAVLSSLERAFCGGGGSTRVFNRYRVGQAPFSYAESVASLRELGATALVVMALQEDPDTLAEALESVRDETRPVVFLTADPLDRPFPHIFYDQAAAGYQAAAHLLKQGLSRLVFFAPFTADWVEERLAGAAKAVAHTKLPESALWIPVQDRERYPWNIDQEEAGYQAARAALESGTLAGTGVIAANDAVAFGLLRAASEWGLTTGQEYALLGFDDLPVSGAAGLTTLRPPLEALGEEAARLVRRCLSGEQTALQVRLQSHLIARASTSRLRVGAEGKL